MCILLAFPIYFKFHLDQTVLTPFGNKAIISCLGFDESGAKYLVKTAEGPMWFKEHQLTDVRGNGK
jgi:hypothetical protein